MLHPGADVPQPPKSLPSFPSAGLASGENVSRQEKYSAGYDRCASIRARLRRRVECFRLPRLVSHLSTPVSSLRCQVAICMVWFADWRVCSLWDDVS